MLKQQGNNEKTPLVNSKQDLGKIFVRQSSNKFNVNLQILCLSQDVFCLFVCFFLIFGLTSPLVYFCHRIILIERDL